MARHKERRACPIKAKGTPYHPGEIGHFVQLNPEAMLGLR